MAGVRIAAWIGGVEAVHVGQQNQQVGPGQLRRAGGQAVVVAVADFLGGDGVVLVDHGDDAVGQQGLDRRAGVQPAAAALGVVAGQQDLGGDQAVGGQGLFPGVHQQGLADGGGGLLVLKPARRGVEAAAPQGHGAGGDDDDLAALLA